MTRSKNVKDISGQRFGRLVAKEYTHSENGHAFWCCACDCGKETNTASWRLLIGKTKSCGCLHADSITKHGLRHHRIYDTWNSMITRCYNKKSKSYKGYGGRGVKVCDRWLNVENFIEDMDSSYKKGLSLDRIDNNGNYELSNCMWTTATRQQRNKRDSKLVTINGVKKHLLDWAEQFGIRSSVAYGRYRKGLRGKDLFSESL